jgi:hypothetical protein
MFGDGIKTKQSLELLDSDNSRQEKNLELKNVFNPAQLAERLLTDEDNINRGSDVPERIQRARKPLRPWIYRSKRWSRASMKKPSGTRNIDSKIVPSQLKDTY